MSTITSNVCQSVEPLSLEPHVLIHQLVPSKQSISCPQKEPGDNVNCWNVMPTNSCELVNEYVHPLSKRSVSSLSSKSLEMCTESLGSETGSSMDEESYGAVQNIGIKTEQVIKKARHISSFPPPLTSIARVRVQTHREGGRLVIKASNVPSGCSCFKHERENGRLRLSLVRDGDGDGNGEDHFWGENVKDEGGKWSGPAAGAMVTGKRGIQVCHCVLLFLEIFNYF